MTPEEYAEEIAELRKEFMESQRQMQEYLSRKSFAQIAAEKAYSLFWNWSFAIGLAMGLCIYPFVMGESNNHSFRLPSMIQIAIQKILNRDQSPNPATVNLKKLAPPNQAKMLESLQSRLTSAHLQHQSTPYLTQEAIKSAIRESCAPMVNVKEWEPFVEAFDRRINSGSSVDDVAKELDAIIKELQ